MLWNTCSESTENSREFALIIASFYLEKGSVEKYPEHRLITVPIRRVYSVRSNKIQTYCFECKNHFCSECFAKSHHIVYHEVIRPDKKRRCSNDECTTRTQKYCKVCEKYLCKICFEILHNTVRDN